MNKVNIRIDEDGETKDANSAYEIIDKRREI